jgi:hypothetical protein
MGLFDAFALLFISNKKFKRPNDASLNSFGKER